MRLTAALLAGGIGAATTDSAAFTIGRTLFSDRFATLRAWTSELEQPGKVETRNGLLSIDVPAGCTVWFRPELAGPLLIQYQARMVQAGGPNDRVSDLNAFWMATDSRSPADLFATRRSGKFADYNQLRTYYVGQGGNGNTTTRFRRYIGDTGRPPARTRSPGTPGGVLLVRHVARPSNWWPWGTAFSTTAMAF